MATNRHGPARGPVLTALDRAERLFNELAQISADAPGVTRASFGPIENAAHDIIRREAKALGLEQRTDAIGNHYVTLAGRNREAPVLMIGSHLDSVPHGGNFDGAAGVLAGLVLLERMAQNTTLAAAPPLACWPQTRRTGFFVPTAGVAWQIT